MDRSSLIVGDFGGTNTRLALMRPAANGWQLGEVEVTATQHDIPKVVKTYWQRQGAPALAGAAFCGAGPLKNGRIALTNIEAVLDARALAAALATPNVLVLNDFEAIAWALPRLAAADQQTLNEGIADLGAAMLVLGPGTGFGAAALLPTPWGHSVVSGEAGHARLAPGPAAEHFPWLALEARKDTLTIEQVLSGRGLARLHQSLTYQALHPAEVADAAWRGEPAAVQAVEAFVSILARVAGDLALTFGARGGVFIGGGIVPKWAGHFPADLFQRAFVNRVEMRSLLEATPVNLVTHAYPALLGLAAAWKCNERLQTQGR